MKNAPCHFGICALCAVHCTCQPQEPEVFKTPKPKRSNREQALAAISKAIVNKTPAAIKSNDTDYRSLKDFDKLVP